jgi:8-oxo-dGTP pyrophosphatase MutT (NUDIX family)
LKTLQFPEIVTHLRGAVQKPLPGLLAHKKLAPPLRELPSREGISKYNPKVAGVLAMIYPIAQLPHICLIKRQEYQGVHSGQISFPGGKMDSTDTNTWQTALRETEEEVGIHRQQINPIGRLTPLYIPVSNFYVEPYLGFSSKKPLFAIQTSEVSRVLEVPLNYFENFKQLGSYPVPGFPGFKAPCFEIDDQIIWGATAMVLSEILHLLDLAKF